jgi:hypothetical protein
MMPDRGAKPESNGGEPELSRLIDLELAQKRARRKEGAARRQKIRIASYFCLVLLILASLFAFYLLFSRVNEERTNPRPPPARSISPP